ncbi:COP9 signalosome complex subunit 1 [Cavenderia fasciculata]|uniref:COP9 signalosome complex subunit 1 n=1 Tax=Cavenderia fasciculata TaxID=261658 RepID=F4PU87_CACFS|nr:COP9 signalosome complex subunit 1 [Cavenderia fasciculata]EGG21802.1 COP9 signalosome complex subunit 1 [Cavenderia fasciculata]|eukprot:XP_004359652.1 COP9 signalosome complex subunit 1 [Cavenderia fasciculata]
MNIDSDDMMVEQGTATKATISSNVFDLDAYINQYTGYTKIQRLLFIADVSKEFEKVATDLAQKEIKKTPNVELYGNLCTKNNLVTYDTQWVESTIKKNASQIEKLEQDLNTAKSNMVKDAIRVCVESFTYLIYLLAHNELGDFYYHSGDFANALKCYIRTRDYCTASKQVLTMCFNIIRVGVDMSNYIHVINYITKAEQTPDLSPQSTAKLRAAMGLSSLENAKYSQAAKKFIEAPFDISGNLSDMISPQDIAIYGGLCALASFDRSELKRKVIDNSVFRNYLELVPEIRELINDFYNSKYSSCLNYLDKLKVNSNLKRYPTLQLDIHLHDHIDKLYQKIRSKSLVQYFSPFSSVDLNAMAAAFNTTVGALEKEISKLIMEDSISARIDSHNKRLYARKTDQRSVTFEKSLQVGKDFQNAANDSLLRMNMLNHNIITQGPRKDNEKGHHGGMGGLGGLDPFQMQMEMNKQQAHHFAFVFVVIHIKSSLSLDCVHVYNEINGSWITTIH